MTSAKDEAANPMNKSESAIRSAIDNLLTSQLLSVLATVRKGQPYSNLMAYVHTPDLQSIVVATGTATRKFLNLQQESRVSLLVDTRNNCEADFHAAESLTVIGTASQVDAEDEAYFRTLYLNRHPYLSDFLSSPATVLIHIKVRHYLLVNRFQNVMEYHTGNGKDIFT